MQERFCTKPHRIVFGRWMSQLLNAPCSGKEEGKVLAQQWAAAALPELLRGECLFVKGFGVFASVYTTLILISRETEQQNASSAWYNTEKLGAQPVFLWKEVQIHIKY